MPAEQIMSNDKAQMSNIILAPRGKAIACRPVFFDKRASRGTIWCASATAKPKASAVSVRPIGAAGIVRMGYSFLTPSYQLVIRFKIM